MDDPAFAPSFDLTTQTILLHASNHDLESLKPLLRTPGNASVQDPETGFTPLHAAIAACGPTPSSKDSISNINGEEGEGEEEEPVDIEKAKVVVKELFLSGAIWNDLDVNDETPGCLAWRLGRKELYELVVEAGVRAEVLLGLMGGYEELGSGSSTPEELDAEVEGETEDLNNGENGTHHPAEETDQEIPEPKRDVNSADFLQSELTFSEDKLLDSDANGVMMSWETSIMRRTVDLLLPTSPPSGARILNIGFGMGIIDRMFRSTIPLSHHIIEAHPAVLAKISSPDSDFGTEWEKSAPEGGKYVIHAGRWQDVIPKLLQEGEVFDVIYFDTFGESYSQLKYFFTEYVVGLLDPKGRFGFFNGLGADRRVCYDVYRRVVELDLCDAGMDVEWTEVGVKLEGKGEGEGEWEGVRRRYWTLEEYWLPVCGFMG